VCFFSSHGSLDVSFSVKEKVLTSKLIFEVEGAFVCLFSSLGIFNHLRFLLEEKVLLLKSFLLAREFDLKESLSLESDSAFP